MKTTYFECGCSSAEHTIRLSYFNDPDYNDTLYLEVHLTNDTFLKRLGRGIKYIFGHTSNYGHFDEVLLNKNTARGMKITIEEFLKFNDRPQNGFIPS